MYALSSFRVRAECKVEYMQALIPAFVGTVKGSVALPDTELESH